MPTLTSYVVITPARNEARFIEQTIRSMISQTRVPLHWVIVSDGSTDETEEIAKAYSSNYPWIELVILADTEERSYAGKARAFEAGYARIRNLSYEAIACVDADVSLVPDYFEFLLDRLAADPNLGVVGTAFEEPPYRGYDYRFSSLEHVSGGCQLFRRACLEAIGGYVPLPGGGVDVVAAVTARMKGWKTRAFTERVYKHHRPMNSAINRGLKRKFRWGEKDYRLGGNPLWQIFRSFYQMSRRPYLVGGLALFAGYFCALLTGKPRTVSKEFREFVGKEQMRRLRRLVLGQRAARSQSASGMQAKMTEASHPVEIRVRGRWIKIPALVVNGKELVSTGKWLRVARVRGEEMMEEGLKDPEVYCAALRSAERKTLGADIFTFTQKATTTQPIFSYPIEWESVAGIRSIDFEGWWEALPQVTRKNVRRSQKRGVTIRVKEFDRELIEGIRSVNDDCPVRQGMKNAYFGQTFDDTQRRYGEFAGRCDFICAYSQEEAIGFLHLVYRQDTAAILNLTVKPSHSDERPANALIAKAVELCCARGISLLTYGLYNHGNKRENSLREFKDRNGFTEIVVPRYFVPLTLWGRIGMKVKLHRGLVGILPHSIITSGVAARSLWYKTWYSIRRCSSMSEQPNSNRQMERSIPPAGST